MSPVSKNILSIGEAMVELSQSPQEGLYSVGISGDTLNTAWYLRGMLDLDWQINYLTRVGTGGFSQRMLEFLKDAGIGTDYIGHDLQREVGLYAISLNNGERSFSYWRDTSAAKALADDAVALGAALSAHSIIYLSGITLAILPQSGRETLLAQIKIARASGTTVVFDTNIRPKLWGDLDLMQHWVMQMAGHSDLMFPSFDDEALYFGDADSQATVARYLAAGAKQVIVKAGGSPIYYGGHEGHGVLEGVTPEPVIDTTAAGDSFNAGYMAAKLQGADLRDALLAGHKLSRQVIRHRGALVEQAIIDAKL